MLTDLSDIGREPTPEDGGWSWVLTVTFAGVVTRWSSRPVDLTVDGTAVPLEPGLDVADVIGGLETTTRAVSVDLYWPEGFDVASHLRDGHRLVGAPGELALVPDGGTWEDRDPVLVGYVSSPMVGHADEPVAFTLQPEDVEDWATVPDPDMTVSPDTFPSAPADSEGTVYPLPFGQPGRYTGRKGTVRFAPATPAVVVDTTDNAGVINADTILISGMPVQATQVRLWYVKGRGYDRTTLPVVQTLDGLSQPVAVVDVTGKTLDGPIRTSGSYAVDWRDGAGVLFEDGTPSTQGLGTLALWWLRRSSVRVDIQRSLAAAALLNRYTFDGYTDEPTTPMEWIADHVLESYPVGIRQGPSGIYLASFDPLATGADAVASLTEGDGTVVRVDRESSEGDGRATAVTVRWGLDILRDRYRGTTTVEPDPTSTGLWTPHPTDGRSVPARRLEVTLDDCWDQGTAYDVGRLLLETEGKVQRRTPLACDADTWAWLQPGMVVKYTDEDLGYTDATCLIWDTGRTSGPWVSVTLWPLTP